MADVGLHPLVEAALRAPNEGVPLRPVRQGWREASEAMHESREDSDMLENLGSNEFDELAWEWL